MSIASLLGSLFNLGGQTDFWNSAAAARDFWIVFAVVAIAIGIVAAVRAHHHHPRLRH